MEIKRKIKTTKATSTFYWFFSSRHILITFVGMTLLIVNYGVNTVQMSAVPHRNGNSNNTSSISGSNVVPSINRNNLEGKNNIYRRILGKIKRNDKSFTNLVQIALPVTPTVYNDNKNVDVASKAYNATSYSLIKNNLKSNSNSTDLNEAELNLMEGKFDKFRKPRLFGLLGSNFSLSYNLSLSSGTSAGNITVVAPAPAYYYAPAPYYPYGYADPYGYYNPYAYNPYAYNPYAYNPYAGYGYYG